MWQFVINSGEIRQDVEHVAWGYSGKGIGKNNPAAQSVPNVGPIPCEFYTIEDPHDTKDHGPFVLRLIPDVTNVMFGRSGFLIHGDSVQAPGTASEGCIIASKLTRLRIWDSGDRRLQVVSGVKSDDKEER